MHGTVLSTRVAAGGPAAAAAEPTSSSATPGRTRACVYAGRKSHAKNGGGGVRRLTVVRTPLAAWFAMIACACTGDIVQPRPGPEPTVPGEDPMDPDAPCVVQGE